MEPIALSWSSGKDSAYALHELRRAGAYEVAALLTTVNVAYGRVSMHGVRRELLRRQAEELGVPLRVVELSPATSCKEYEGLMAAAMEGFKAEGIRKVAFGDLFLEDIRKYREGQLARAGMEALFPLWGRPTGELAREMIDAGFRSVVTCVDTRALDRSFAGLEFSRAMLDALPPGADPCGENGEFHTFCHAGPVFRRPLRVATGDKVLRDDRFYFCDVAER